MKRSLLDITQKLSRNPKKVVLIPKDLTNSDYWIFEAKGWRFVALLREIEYRDTQDRLEVYINTQTISARDYLVEQTGDGISLKFIKSSFEYQLDNIDYIEIEGDIEYYA